MDLSGNDLIDWAVSILGQPRNSVLATPLSRGADRTGSSSASPGPAAAFFSCTTGRIGRRTPITYPSAGFCGKSVWPCRKSPHHDDAHGFVMMEDLGDMDLWAHRLDPAESRLELYRADPSADLPAPRLSAGDVSPGMPLRSWKDSTQNFTGGNGTISGEFCGRRLWDPSCPGGGRGPRRRAGRSGPPVGRRRTDPCPQGPSSPRTS